MTRLRTIELSDTIGALPDLRPFHLALPPSERDTAFICALGFEQRGLALCKALAESGYKADRALYLRYSTNQDDNNAQLPELLGYLETIADSVDPIDADEDDFTNRLRATLAPVGDAAIRNRGITFDISVAANRIVLQVMKVLFDYQLCLRIGYAEAGIYRPTKEEYEANPQLWEDEDEMGLARGVHAIHVSTEHGGHHLDPLPDCIIAFPTFRREHILAMISAIDPSLIIAPGKRVVWVLGIPHLEEDSWRKEAMRRINRLTDAIPQIEVSTFSYKDTLAKLHEAYLQRWSDYKITLCPLGSKLQAVGIALFHELHPDVRVLFAVPQEYNAANYSSGVKALWELPYFDVRDTRTLLRSVGTLRIENGGQL